MPRQIIMHFPARSKARRSISLKTGFVDLHDRFQRVLKLFFAADYVYLRYSMIYESSHSPGLRLVGKCGLFLLV